MNKRLQIFNLLTIMVILYTATGFAQDTKVASSEDPETNSEETAQESEAVPAGQEVEINEDNYRQFMELKDARLRRNMLPENSYKSQAGAQKIDKLPEESQKHLRNELREIIIQGDPWQPGDEGTEYPYVPSNAASTNPALQKKETDAWSELVNNYHKREAGIYANASRSQAASATANSAGEGSGENDASGSGNQGQGSEGQQAGQQDSSKQANDAGSYSPNNAADSNAKSTAGVSQNAMEFLQGQGNQPGNAGEASAATFASNNGQAGEQADSSADSQAGEQVDGQAQAGQQSDDQQNRTADTFSESASAPSPDEAKSTAGASQNALEYLMGASSHTSQTTDGESENPLPELPSLTEPVPGSGQPAAPGSGEQQGTLTIEDLINAQGIGNAAGTDSPSNSVNDEQGTDKNPPDNGG